MSAGEICNRDVVVIEREGSLTDVVKLMREHHVGDVVVVDERDGQRVPVGILTDRDVVVEILAEEVDFNALAVGDVMSYPLLSVREDEEALDVLKRMRAEGVRRVPVVNLAGGLIGILTADDLIELMAEQLSDLSALIAKEQQRERRRMVQPA